VIGTIIPLRRGRCNRSDPATHTNPRTATRGDYQEMLQGAFGDCPTRRRDARQNREQILSAALHALSAHPEASIEETARAAGLTRRIVYGHFANHDALLLALLDAIAG
jgi:hypothetical protein